MMATIARAVAPKIAAVRRLHVAEIASSILGTQIVTSVLGVAFWTLAARGLSQSSVGQLGSATASTMFVGAFGTLGAGTLLISRIGSTVFDRRRELFVASVVSGALGGACLAVVFAASVWIALPAFRFFAPTHAAFWWLIAASSLTSAGGVFDQAMLVVGRPRMQVARNATSSLVKLAVFGVAVGAGLNGLNGGLAAWTVGQSAAATLALSTAWRALPTASRLTAGGLLSVTRRHWREAVGHHVANMALWAPSMLQPVIVSALISAESNAVFTTVRLVSTLAFMVPYALAVALFASAAVNGDDLERRARSVLKVSLVLSLLTYAVLFASAHVVLDVFGHTYADDGERFLRIIGLGCPLLVFKDQFIARARVRHETSRIIRYVVSSMVLEMSGTFVGAAMDGLRGALFGWLTALAIGAIWVLSHWRTVNAAAKGAGSPPGRGTHHAVSAPPYLPDRRIGTVSVVICTFDIVRFDQLIDCLHSIDRQTRKPDAVVVVVDGSDAVAAALGRRGGPETVVVHPANRGLSASRNTGVAHVSSDWVAFLDDDATADPQWLERLLDCAAEMEAVGVGGRSDPVFSTAAPSWLPEEFLWAVGCSYRGMPERRSIQRNTFGGCAVLKTSLFSLVGGYDVSLGRRGSGTEGGEEADFCVRVSEADPTARFAHAPDAVIYHHVGIARLNRRYLLRRCYSDGKAKSSIARSSGATALGVERRYMTRTVPAAFVRAVGSLNLQRAFMVAAADLSGHASALSRRQRRGGAGGR